MRIEKRERTVYEEIYIADDGTQFDTERHCLNYERECRRDSERGNAVIHKICFLLERINEDFDEKGTA